MDLSSFRIDFGREDVGPGIIQKDKSEESTPERICHSDKLSENERNIKPICFNQIADEESKFEDKHDFESKNITKDNEHNIEESKELDYQEEEEEENEAEDDLENDQVYIEEDDDENDDFEIQLQQKELESKQKQK